MSRFAEPMVRLIEELKKLPGIGSKTAQRLAFYILRSNDEDAEALAAAVRDVKASLRLCSVCKSITCCMERFHRCMVSVPNNCVFPT